METAPKPKEPLWSRLAFWTAVLFAVLLMASVALGPTHGVKQAIESASMQQCRTIAIAMNEYASKHSGQYPVGVNSTEVFQKLLDDHDVVDAAVFYVPMAGKTKPPENGPLRPENVGFDVTAGIDKTSPPGLPIVFMTGFRIDYHADGKAISLIKPYPKFQSIVKESWLDSRNTDGISIGLKSDEGYFKNAWSHAPHPSRKFTEDGYGIVSNVIAADFDAHGQTYRQLTPEGPLEPK